MHLNIRYIAILFLFISLSSPSKTLAYKIEGQINGFQNHWSNRIFLASIRSVNDFQAASKNFIVNETIISKDGRFEFKGNNLPDDLQFYRVYLVTGTGNETQLIQGSKSQNFIHLLLSNSSQVQITGDLNSKLFYESRITGSPFIAMFNGFYEEIYDLQDNNLSATTTQINLNEQKYFKLIKSSINKNNNSYFTIFALAHINWEKKYIGNELFFNKCVADLQKHLPGNSYVKEYKDNLTLNEFRNSQFKPFLNIYTIVTLFSLCLLLLITVTVLLIRQYKTPAIKLVTPVVLDRLTQKESEIAKLVLEGKSNKEISTSLFIEVSTVKSHISSIYQKLNISSRKELVIALNSSQ